MKLLGESPETVEQLGSKPKFWFRWEGDTQPWLFKFTREHTGEDWAEKIGAEIAHLMGVPAAKIELAEFNGKWGVASRSFVEKEKGFDLIHGSEVLAGRVLGYDKEKQWNQSAHSMDNSIQAIGQSFPGVEATDELKKLAGYVVLDGLIGNVDRHHDNWALLRGPGEEGAVVRAVAPSYDHASSLGRELHDERRQLLLAQGRVEQYVRKGAGGIYWDAQDAKGLNPLDLAIRATAKWPLYFRPWIRRVNALDPNDFNAILTRVPATRMSGTAREFCMAMLLITTDALRRA